MPRDSETREVRNLRRKAEEYRAKAKNTSDAKLKAGLEAIAREFEARAKAIEDKSSG